MTTRGSTPPLPATSFDFLIGQWEVRNFRLERRLSEEESETGWTEFRSTMRASWILGQRGVAESYSFPAFPAVGEFHGFILRLHDSAEDLWRIWWTSSESAGVLDPPLIGGFVNGEGVFEGEDLYDGRRALVQTRYSKITRSSFRWAQCFSFDGGQTYRSDWIMDFQRRR